MAEDGLVAAFATGDTDRIYAWLMDLLSLQGISNDIAFGYIEAHGNADRPTIRDHLATTRCACPKLAGFEAHLGCRYRKEAATCARPQHLRLCPVRKLPLRKGLLNVQAYSLHFFLRDLCGDDLAGFIDGQIAAAKAEVAEPDGDDAGDGGDADADETSGRQERGADLDWIDLARARLVTAFSRIEGVSSKLANMILADILLGGRPDDPDWEAVGATCIVVDSLVHKFLDRTGILKACKAPHAYGVACHRDHGCDGVIRQLARRIDASTLRPGYPAYFPRAIQAAIWMFCTASELDVCNAANVGKGRRCEMAGECPVAGMCVRGRGRGRGR
jgi:hypothetical protein